MKKAIRDEYAEKGVEAFYKSHADVYENPHFKYIKALLEQNQHRIDCSKVLDFCSGGGEVTLILRGLLGEHFNNENILGTDPFTTKLYKKNTDCACLPYNFEEVIKGRLTKKLGYNPEEEPIFTAIICSFAMHLCPEKQLYPLVSQLFLLSKNIVIITPHKRPQLEDLTGVQLTFEDFVLTEKGKKVFLKNYELIIDY
jgi:hypothetical protein